MVGFIGGVGTGGTLAGGGTALRERRSDVAIGLADPMGAALYSYYPTGVLERSGNSITEGIGHGRIPRHLDGLTIDAPFQLPHEHAIPVVSEPLRHAALCLAPPPALPRPGPLRLPPD